MSRLSGWKLTSVFLGANLKFLKVKEENFIQKAIFDTNQQTTCNKHTTSNHKNSKTQNEGIWVNVW